MTVFQESISNILDTLPKEKQLLKKRFFKDIFPKRGDPKYRFFPLNKFEQYSLTLPKRPLFPDIEKRANTIHFFEGFFAKDLSSVEGCELMSLSEAKNTYAVLLQKHFQQAYSEEEDIFALLNGLCFEEGAFLYVPPEVEVELDIVYHQVAEALSFPRLHIIAGQGSSVKILKKVVDGDRSTLHEYIHVTLEKKAHLYLHEEADDQEKLEKTLSSTRVYQKKESFFESVLFGTSGVLSRSEYQVYLQGERAECSLMGAYDMRAFDEMHTHVKVLHEAEETVSNQLFKAILHDRSKHSFDGKIYVKPQAQKTEAYQLNNTLLLSDEARSFSQPNLEIFADDVKASHGATCGQLSENELFFMQSRGINFEDAQELLFKAFLREVSLKCAWDRLSCKR